MLVFKMKTIACIYSVCRKMNTLIKWSYNPCIFICEKNNSLRVKRKGVTLGLFSEDSGNGVCKELRSDELHFCNQTNKTHALCECMRTDETLVVFYTSR